MAEKIRIMLVDDSAVIRRLLTDVLTGDPQLEVVGSAQNGQIALEKLPILNPDLVILDVEMPVMDGLETLTEIRKRQPRLPIIMFSSITERGAVVTLEALARGANDYITKPANTGNMSKSLQRVRDELIPRVKAFCQHLLGPPAPVFPTSRPPVPQRPVSPEPAPAPLPVAPLVPIAAPPPRHPAAGLRARVDVVAIGVSTGGPNALATLLSRFPAQFPVPIVIVQHMPPIFTRLLAERLATQTTLSVAEGVAGEALQPGQIRLAPGGSHMVLARQGGQVCLQLNQDEPENSCRPAVDVLFRSVAAIYRANTLAVILTGMGNDGLKGCEAIHNAGGQILVQDEASSVVWGMPGFVAKAGLADGQIALPQLAREILNRVRINR
ncbi:MAG: chemotaxis response regulator protein-glutamate methylesterase [Candidatus Competibacteraceae bacterium]|nr:chemotaxis response regulator protein-glutamate methylesterase [Candidatus Competibacteraceae bacterium]MCP5125009.1 chemotaxis response regulator protein-glutamate methylesterase [Gammaproteobacteria bacterium]